MLQKIIRVGNSLAVTIPKQFIDSLGISEEDVIEVQPVAKRKKIVLDFANEEKTIDNIVDREVYKVAKHLLKRYLPAFKELAKK